MQAQLVVDAYEGPGNERGTSGHHLGLGEPPATGVLRIIYQRGSEPRLAMSAGGNSPEIQGAGGWRFS